MPETATSPRYPQPKQPDFPTWEKEILALWEAQGTFEASVTSREGQPAFTFYEGPPSANGAPGIHHVMARTIKDLFCRYKTLKGFQVQRKAGWDTHGLPIELSVEKTLGITKKDIGTKISVEEYNAACRREVMKYTEQWDQLTRQMGYWVDLGNPYVTYENNYIESVWHLLKRLYDKQLVYKGYTIQPYSPAAGTGLSSHELNQPGCYRLVKDTSCIAMFAIKSEAINKIKPWIAESLFLDLIGNTKPINLEIPKTSIFFLAWTTTPWTLPANAALAVGEKITYALVETFNTYTRERIYVWLAKDRLNAYFAPESEVPNPHLTSPTGGGTPLPEGGDGRGLLPPADWPKNPNQLPWRVLAEKQGKELEGMQYEQLMPYITPQGKAFEVIPGDFVTTEDGTGIVHIAPTFGADDKRVADQFGISPIGVSGADGSLQPIVDREGKYVPEMGEWAGRYVKNYTDDPHYQNLDVDICVHLKERNRAFRVEKYEHNYPHCWRTDKPVLYYPLDSWFVATSKAKDKLVAKNREINWKPESTGTGRFGHWLENLVDWNLSRSRFWGIPLPIWVNKSRTKITCIGSLAELADALQHAITKDVNAAANREYLDRIIPHLTSPSGEGTPLPEGGDGGGLEDESTGGYTAHPEFSAHKLKEMKEKRLALRKNLTSAEAELWKHLKNKQLDGHKFRRQHSIGYFIVDFFCYEEKLAIELDGEVHHTEAAQAYDKERTEYLNQLGIRVIRFANKHVFESANEVLSEIRANFISPHLTSPTGGGLLDLHRPYIDEIVLADSTGEPMYREPDLIDVWFDSGAMPFAQWHYPFENQDIFRRNYPADFIAEGVDQTRGWFFTLHAISAL
ncbi:MAG: class I tRNA ligase family protein, partial [Bacteroidetes bacterium]|nr:class I tRNA ligase family protein [Bacteroidota bacterium]